MTPEIQAQRDAFRAVLVEFEGLPLKHENERNALQLEYEEALRKLWRDTPGFSKRKVPEYEMFHPKRMAPDVEKMKKRLPSNVVPDVDLLFNGVFQPRASKMFDDHRAASKRLVKTLIDLAGPLSPLPTEARSSAMPYLYSDHRAGNYHTQGYGASRYAKCLAELDAAHARIYGIEAVVFESRSHTSYRDYGVHVFTLDVIDVAILQRKPYLSLREQVRLCWANGCQPRVFNPWLPFDYEAKEGLDYQGNEVTFLRRTER